MTPEILSSRRSGPFIGREYFVFHVRQLSIALLLVVSSTWAENEAKAQGPTSLKSKDVVVTSFSKGEKKRLLNGQDVRRPLKSDVPGQKWVGGLAYQAIEGNPLALLAALKSEALLCRMVVYCRDAQVLSNEDGEMRLRVRQKKGPIVVEYTLLIRYNIARQEALFWLDTRDPHDVNDLWGYFRLTPFTPGRSLITFGIAIEVPFAARLLEKPIQKAALSMPSKWKKDPTRRRN